MLKIVYQIIPLSMLDRQVQNVSQLLASKVALDKNLLQAKPFHLVDNPNVFLESVVLDISVAVDGLRSDFSL